MAEVTITTVRLRTRAGGHQYLITALNIKEEEEEKEDSPNAFRLYALLYGARCISER